MTDQKTDHTSPVMSAGPVPPLLELTTMLSQSPHENDPEAPNSLQYNKTVPVLLDDLIQTRLLIQADIGAVKSWCMAVEWRGDNGVERLENHVGKKITQLTRREASDWIEKLTPKEDSG